MYTQLARVLFDPFFSVNWVNLPWGNQSILSRYASIVCDNSRNSSFLTDPTVAWTGLDLMTWCPDDLMQNNTMALYSEFSH